MNHDAMEMADELPVAISFDSSAATAKFTQNGKPVDPRPILAGLASGQLKIVVYKDATTWEVLANDD